MNMKTTKINDERILSLKLNSKHEKEKTKMTTELPKLKP
jgi:hypothetical protein